MHLAVALKAIQRGVPPATIRMTSTPVVKTVNIVCCMQLPLPTIVVVVDAVSFSSTPPSKNRPIFHRTPKLLNPTTMSSPDVAKLCQRLTDFDQDMRMMALFDLQGHIKASKPLSEGDLAAIVSQLERVAGPTDRSQEVRRLAATVLLSLQSQLSAVSGADRALNAALVAQRAERDTIKGPPESLAEIDSLIRDLESALSSLQAAP